jgi:putative transposase
MAAIESRQSGQTDHQEPLMARMSRLAVAGYPHHLIQRGNNRSDIVVDDEDRRRYLYLLREAARLHEVAIHAYVLMDNHVHLLATPASDEGLSRMMQTLGRNYVGWFNHRHQRSGTLWEGRFRSSLIESDGYLLSCMRYIELNPVRARMVPAAEEFPWSSARHHVGLAKDVLINDHALYWAMGNTPFEREAAYRRFLQQPVPAGQDREFAESCVKGWALGSKRFLAELDKQLGRRLRPVGRGRPRRNDSVPK